MSLLLLYRPTQGFVPPPAPPVAADGVTGGALLGYPFTGLDNPPPYFIPPLTDEDIEEAIRAILATDDD